MNRRDTGDVKVSVTDTGCGIAPSHQQQIFTPFNRLGFENTTIEGMGIGLVRSLCALFVVFFLRLLLC